MGIHKNYPLRCVRHVATNDLCITMLDTHRNFLRKFSKLDNTISKQIEQFVY